MSAQQGVDAGGTQEIQKKVRKRKTKSPEKKREHRQKQKTIKKVKKATVQAAFTDLVMFLPTVLERNGHDGTSGDDLDRIARMQFGDRFKGVFAANTHPADMSEGFYIVNTDPFHKPGVHWTAVADGLFYDSFDRKSTTLFPDVILPATKKNQSVAQLNKESNCGERCIAFLVCAAEFGNKAAKDFL